MATISAARAAMTRARSTVTVTVRRVFMRRVLVCAGADRKDCVMRPALRIGRRSPVYRPPVAAPGAVSGTPVASRGGLPVGCSGAPESDRQFTGSRARPGVDDGDSGMTYRDGGNVRFWRGRAKIIGGWEVMPIDPATEWSEQLRTTAVEYQSHIRLVDFSAGGQRKHFWALVELTPKGEPPGQTTQLALAAAAFRLFWLSILAQARAFHRR